MNLRTLADIAAVLTTLPRLRSGAECSPVVLAAVKDWQQHVHRLTDGLHALSDWGLLGEEHLLVGVFLHLHLGADQPEHQLIQTHLHLWQELLRQSQISGEISALLRLERLERRVRSLAGTGRLHAVRWLVPDSEASCPKRCQLLWRLSSAALADTAPELFHHWGVLKSPQMRRLEAIIAEGHPGTANPGKTCSNA